VAGPLGFYGVILMLFAAKWGGLLALVALITLLVKQLIAFLAFVTGVIQLIVILAFAAVFIGVAYLIYRAWQDNRRKI
jgi:hypothetical protein